MSLPTTPLPSDFASLQAFAIALQAENDTLKHERGSLKSKLQLRDAELYAKTLHIEKLKAELALLRRARFGRSSEKLDRDIAQLELLIGDLEESRAENNERTRSTLPAAAPRKEKT